MKLEWLESFVAFAETRNFTRAAERLHLSQPALHTQVAKLGEDLGVTLYHRTGRNVELSQDGQAVEAFARETLGRVEALRARLRGAEAPVTPVLCAGHGTQLHMIADTVRRWVRTGRPVTLTAADKDGIVEAVVTGRAHLGIAPLETVPTGTRARLYRTVGQVGILRKDHRWAGRSRLSLQLLGAEPLILPPGGKPHREAVVRALHAAGEGARIAIEAVGWELMMHYASVGMGIAVVNGYCKPPNGCVALPIPALPSLRYQLIQRAQSAVPEEVERLAEFLMKSGEAR